jgi:HPt (histidine-containing phosphotransfer) domain-containing protein
MDDYVSKPIQIRELRAALERARRSPEGPPPPPTLDPALVASPAELEREALAGYHQLRDLLGTTTADEIAALFLREADELMDRLRVAIAAGDPDGVREAAHSLKGSSGGLRLMSLHAIAAALETRGSAGDLLAAPLLFGELERQYGLVHEHLAVPPA